MTISDFDFLISKQDNNQNPYFADKIDFDYNIEDKKQCDNVEDKKIKIKKRVIINTPNIDTTNSTNSILNSNSNSSYSYIDMNIINSLVDAIISKIENKIEMDGIDSQYKSKNKVINILNTNYSKSESDYDDIITCSKYEINDKTKSFDYKKYNNIISPLDVISIVNFNKNVFIQPFDGEVFIPYVEKIVYAGSRDENLIKANPGIKNQRLFLKRRAEALNRIYTITTTEEEQRVFLDDIVLDLNLHLDLLVYLFIGNYKINSLFSLESQYNILNRYRIKYYIKDRIQNVFYYDEKLKKIYVKFSKYIDFKIWFYNLLNSDNIELKLIKNLKIINMLLYYYEHRKSDDEFKIYYNNIINNSIKFIHENMNKEVRLYGTIHYRTYCGKEYKEKLILYINNIREIEDRNINNIKSKPIIIDSLAIIIPNKFRIDKLDFDFTPGNEIAFIGKVVRNFNPDNKAKYTVDISYLETFMSKTNMKKYQEYEKYQKYKSYSDCRHF